MDAAQVPTQPKLYHIVHGDRLPSIIAVAALMCDADMRSRNGSGTTIGMGTIKTRRMATELTSRPGLHVGECVPFYFCPRSVMLYVIHMANHPDLIFRGGQAPIVHLQADLHAVVAWAEQEGLRWAFTLSNAGSNYFEDRCDLKDLAQLDWDAIGATSWQTRKEGKQAEFLVEKRMPWSLVERIGVRSAATRQQVYSALTQCGHQPPVHVLPDWYY
ncbi:MAG: DUF4433 domain-containing protein [Deltaproteobacteria bacterium]|nr:DUF4433 domain-containing protein [Deltaproteobacteria bacterium]